MSLINNKNTVKILFIFNTVLLHLNDAKHYEGPK